MAKKQQKPPSKERCRECGDPAEVRIKGVPLCKLCVEDEYGYEGR